MSKDTWFKLEFFNFIYNYKNRKFIYITKRKSY